MDSVLNRANHEKQVSKNDENMLGRESPGMTEVLQSNVGYLPIFLIASDFPALAEGC